MNIINNLLSKTINQDKNLGDITILQEIYYKLLLQCFNTNSKAICYNLDLSIWVKENVLVNTRELSRVPNIGISTLYTSSIWFVYTLHLVYPKYYKLYR